ncbi:hypothetical protein TNCV_3747411 [Trichonephila clavipes]|nr:hypothetical protein TNCV_3747411 [Trichonephila clavipes]
MNLRSACRAFEPCTVEDPPCRGGRYTLSMLSFKCPPVGMWLATLAAVSFGLISNPGEDMDVCKCIVTSQYRGTLNSRRAASPLVRLVEGKERTFSQTILHPEHVYLVSVSSGPSKPVLRMSFLNESIRNVGERDSSKPFSPTSSEHSPQGVLPQNWDEAEQNRSVT